VTQETIIAVALMLAVVLTASFFAFVYGLKRRAYLLSWTGAWALLAVRSVGEVLDAVTQRTPGEPSIHHTGQLGLFALAAVLFLVAARQYAQARRPGWVTVILLALSGTWITLFHLNILAWSPYWGIAGLLFAVGSVFSAEGRKQESVADGLLGVAFFVWGLLVLGTVLRGQVQGWSTSDVRLLALIPQLFAAVFMVMAQYEEEKRRIERNMLALSNLNLATSSFAGGEIQKMLAQALERVLSVVRIPSGALLLQHGGEGGPGSIIATGMSSRFTAEAHKEGLDESLVRKVAQLGGIGVFRELGKETQWEEMEREDAFRRFRELAASEGLRTVVCISLQAKERVFGALLLGTPDSRRFTPAELRLLLALGHQIAMAVENSFLVQQTSRRTEELHILNEIGRALSSTLDVEALFNLIFTELQRLFDVSNFYIAFYDSGRNEVRFEVEVVNNVRQPRRQRTAGNHLTEYMIRTRQPVLIREQFLEETQKLGVDVLKQTGCFCGVPLVLYDRAIGAMAVHSPQERVFDEAHLELMRVLASQAGVAIENARLFSEEQKKSRHLNLINNISRHAITTLNPDELLTEIVNQMEGGLSYDHIGIAMLDYSSKEVVIQAEAGKRREALGRRIALGEGLLGQVARTGQVAIVRGTSGSGPRPVLLTSKAAIAFPVVYGDQLMGVLYVETAESWDFAEEEIQLLRTLADLVAGALHNAMTFQKAQEQAITDGLTGLKTHRFFMEALAAEWKRATRAGRHFSLVLIDLDRFKFVNDFHGHLAGDAVLQRIARVLEQNCRRSDVVSRYGGDEFVIMMPETNVEQAVQLAGKLRACVEADPLLHDKNITGSFGLATFPVHGSTPQELIQVADSAMYISKHHGGNRVSTPEQAEAAEPKKWKRDVLEAYLGVTLKRLFTTGPEAFDEIYRRLEQFAVSLDQNPEAGAAGEGHTANLAPAVIEMLTSLAVAVDNKDHYTQGHSQKVSGYAALLARAVADGHGRPRLAQPQVEEIRLAALLHDVGKVGIPEAILNKSGPLNSEEWETMRAHTALGARLLEPLRVADHLVQTILHHHEFYDGSGYPGALPGAQIPLGARIVAIADAFDTITSDRAYKKARSVADALAEIERCAGTQFDPELARLFIELIRNRPGETALLSADADSGGVVNRAH
jgi:diguanylate cyclase (GGDEF)-like protein